MYDHVIWPEQFHPKISAIYGLNDIDVEAPSHRWSAAEIPPPVPLSPGVGGDPGPRGGG
jgi:hypothetical protein